MSDTNQLAKKSPWRRRAMILGIVVAILCHAVPPDYRAACELVASVCTGGLK